MKMLGSTLIVVALAVLAMPVSAGPITSLRPRPIHRTVPPVPAPVSPPTSVIRTDLPNTAPIGMMYQHRRMPVTPPHSTVKHHSKRSRGHHDVNKGRR